MLIGICIYKVLRKKNLQNVNQNELSKVIPINELDNKYFIIYEELIHSGLGLKIHDIYL